MKYLLRNLVRYRRYTVPNIIGLGVALGALIVIFQFVSFQLSFDRFYENDLCRVIITKYQDGDLLQKTGVTYSAVGPALVNDHPAIIKQSRIFPFGNAIIQDNGKSTALTRAVAVEHDFFEMFEIALLAGNGEEVFNRPNQLVLTATTAQQAFGNTPYHELIDRQVRLDNDSDLYTIVGIMEDMPANSHLTYNLFMSYPTIISTWQLSEADYDWNMVDFRHYVQLREGTDLEALNAALVGFGSTYRTMSDTDYDRFELERMEDVYLSEHELEYDIALHGDRKTIYMLSLLAILLFVVSWINFVNLNSSMALEKVKPTGIRKVLGVTRQGLRKALVSEVLIIFSLATVIGLGLSVLATIGLQSAGFDLLSLQEVLGSQFLHGPLLLILTGFILLGGVSAAMLHYRLTSSVRALDAIRARSGQKVKGAGLANRALLAFQFTLSLVTLSFGLVINQQQRQINEAPLGVDLENAWVIRQPSFTPSDSTFKGKLNAFKSTLTSVPGVSMVTSNQRTPGQQIQIDYESEMRENKQALGYILVDQEYLETYQLPLVAGRNFTSADVKTRMDNLRQVIVNERALKELGFDNANDIIGERLDIIRADCEVIGVVADHRQQSILHDFQPIAYLPMVSAYHQIVLKADVPLDQWLGVAERAYSELFPGNPFEYRELAAEYHTQYASIYSASKSLQVFTLLIVIISLFGMIALASLNLLSRIKEIGIKKVLGASNQRLYLNVISTYAVLFAAAFVVAAPVVYLLSENWMNQYSYRINISPLTYLGPALLLIVVISGVLLAISRKVVNSNPVEALKV